MQTTVVPRLEWKWLLAVGIAMMLVGVALIAAPAASSAAVTWLIGVALIAYGALALGAAWLERVDGVRFSSVVFALLSVLAGLLLSFNVLAGTVTLTAIVIAWLFADGVVGLLSTPLVEPQRRIGWLFVSAVTLLLGVLLLIDFPSSATWLLGVYAGLALVLRGVVATWAALELRHVEQVDRPRTHVPA